MCYKHYIIVLQDRIGNFPRKTYIQDVITGENWGHSGLPLEFEDKIGNLNGCIFDGFLL